LGVVDGEAGVVEEGFAEGDAFAGEGVVGGEGDLGEAAGDVEGVGGGAGWWWGGGGCCGGLEEIGEGGEDAEGAGEVGGEAGGEGIAGAGVGGGGCGGLLRPRSSSLNMVCENARPRSKSSVSYHTYWLALAAEWNPSDHEE
jgi:hypothetical protein